MQCIIDDSEKSMLSIAFTRPSITFIIRRNAVTMAMNSQALFPIASMIVLSSCPALRNYLWQGFLSLHFVLHYRTYVYCLRLSPSLNLNWRGISFLFIIPCILYNIFLTFLYDLVCIFHLVIIDPVALVLHLLLLMQFSVAMSEIILKVAHIDHIITVIDLSVTAFLIILVVSIVLNYAFALFKVALSVP